MSYRAKGLVLAIEEETAAVVDVPNENIDVPVEINECIQKHQEAADEISDITGAIDDAITDAGSIGKISEVMAESVEKGEGLDGTSAELAEIAVESICRRLGIRNAKIIPAVESFGGSKTRIEATQVAIEGLSETMTRVWTAIKTAIANAATKISEFFKDAHVTHEKIKEHANQLVAAIGKLEGTPIQTEMENKTLAEAFYAGGDTTFKSAMLIVDNHEKISNATVGVLPELKSALGQALKDLKGEEVKALAEKLIKIFTDLPDKTTGSKTVTRGNYKTHLSGYLHYLQHLYVTITTARELNYLPDIEIGWDEDWYTSDPVINQKVPVLTIPEMKKAIESALTLIKINDEFKQKTRLMEEITKELTAAADRILTLLEKFGDAENKDVQREVDSARTVLRSALTSFTWSVVEIPTVNLHLSRDLLKYVAASAKLYTAKTA